MIDLDNLRKLEAAATPGPWKADDNGDVLMVSPPHGWESRCVAVTDYSRLLRHNSYLADAALIAAMRNALAPLLADHARLGAEVVAIKDERDNALTCFEVTRNSCERRGAKLAEAKADLTTELAAHQATRDELRRLTKAYEAMTIEERLLTTERARLADALARGRAEAARLTRELADSEESAGSWREQAQLVAAEVARLRGLVERACDALDSSTPDWGTGPKTWRSAAIRKEAAGE